MGKIRIRLVYLVSLVIFLLTPVLVRAAEMGDVSRDASAVEVTEERALEMAQCFFDETWPVKVESANPVKLYKSDGRAIGYIVEALCDGRPHGYIVYDFGRSWNIAEFSQEKGARFLIGSLDAVRMADESSSSGSRIIALDGFTYGLVDAETGLGVGSDGTAVSVPEAVDSWSSEAKSRNNSVDANPFEKVLTDQSALYKQGYKVDSANALSGYTPLMEMAVINYTNHYACEVSALYTLCSHYVDLGGMLDLKSHYMNLWDLSNTSVHSVDKNGVVFGSTASSSAVKAIGPFCSKLGKTVNARFAMSPTWDEFKQTVDKKNMSIFSGRLRSNGLGHSMAVVGYMTLTNSYSGSKMSALMVCDGWGYRTRVLPYDTSVYINYDGIFCS